MWDFLQHSDFKQGLSSNKVLLNLSLSERLTALAKCKQTNKQKNMVYTNTITFWKNI